MFTVGDPQPRDDRPDRREPLIFLSQPKSSWVCKVLQTVFCKGMVSMPDETGSRKSDRLYEWGSPSEEGLQLIR